MSCGVCRAKWLTLNGFAEVPENRLFAPGWRLAGKYSGIVELVVYKYACGGGECINIRSAKVAIRTSVRLRAMRFFYVCSQGRLCIAALFCLFWCIVKVETQDFASHKLALRDMTARMCADESACK